MVCFFFFFQFRTEYILSVGGKREIFFNELGSWVALCFLYPGVLRLYVDKETYEKSGLVGRPDGSTKTKRAKARWGKGTPRSYFFSLLLGTYCTFCPFLSA